MKILLDHNLDRRLKNYLTAYETATTQEQNWADALNGELPALAEERGKKAHENAVLMPVKRFRGANGTFWLILWDCCCRSKFTRH